jgi:hypothetical protein
MNTHFHVTAIQKLSRRIRTDAYTRPQAEAWAAGMVRADHLYTMPMPNGIDGNGKTRFDLLDAEFGEFGMLDAKLDEPWRDLISECVNPGWEAVWIIPCAGLVADGVCADAMRSWDFPDEHLFWDLDGFRAGAGEKTPA